MPWPWTRAKLAEHWHCWPWQIDELIGAGYLDEINLQLKLLEIEAQAQKAVRRS